MNIICEEIEKLKFKGTGLSEWKTDMNYAYGKAQEIVEKFTKDPEDIGVWVKPNTRASSYKYQCSKCGEIAYFVSGNCAKEVKDRGCAYKYCPNCGRRMKG